MDCKYVKFVTKGWSSEKNFNQTITNLTCCHLKIPLMVILLEVIQKNQHGSCSSLTFLGEGRRNSVVISCL